MKFNIVFLGVLLSVFIRVFFIFPVLNGIILSIDESCEVASAYTIKNMGYINVKSGYLLGEDYYLYTPLFHVFYVSLSIIINNVYMSLFSYKVFLLIANLLFIYVFGKRLVNKYSDSMQRFLHYIMLIAIISTSSNVLMLTLFAGRLSYSMSLSNIIILLLAYYMSIRSDNRFLFSIIFLTTILPWTHRLTSLWTLILMLFLLIMLYIRDNNTIESNRLLLVLIILLIVIAFFYIISIRILITDFSRISILMQNLSLPEISKTTGAQILGQSASFYRGIRYISNAIDALLLLILSFYGILTSVRFKDMLKFKISSTILLSFSIIVLISDAISLLSILNLVSMGTAEVEGLARWLFETAHFTPLFIVLFVIINTETGRRTLRNALIVILMILIVASFFRTDILNYKENYNRQLIIRAVVAKFVPPDRYITHLGIASIIVEVTKRQPFKWFQYSVFNEEVNDILKKYSANDLVLVFPEKILRSNKELYGKNFILSVGNSLIVYYIVNL